MYERVIHRYFVLLTCLLVRTACAQNSAEPLPKPLPVIHGEIYGLKAAAQGNMAVFFAGKKSVGIDESCDEDLNCAMQKYRIGTIAVNSEGVLLLPQENTEPEVTAGNSSDFTSPSRTLNTLDIAPARTQAVFLSSRQSGHSPALASVTFCTGDPVVDQTPSLVFINRETMSLLANTITTVNLLSASGRVTEGISLVEPTSSRTASVFSTVTVEAEGISGLLTSMEAVPTSVGIEREREAENGEEQRAIRLKTESEILEIRPTPTYDSTDSSRGQWTFTVREVTNTASDSSSTSAPNATPASDAEVALTRVQELSSEYELTRDFATLNAAWDCLARAINLGSGVIKAAALKLRPAMRLALAKSLFAKYKVNNTCNYLNCAWTHLTFAVDEGIGTIKVEGLKLKAEMRLSYAELYFNDYKIGHEPATLMQAWEAMDKAKEAEHITEKAKDLEEKIITYTMERLKVEYLSGGVLTRGRLFRDIVNVLKFSKRIRERTQTLSQGHS